MQQLLDQFGNPIDMTKLREEQAGPTLSGVRTQFAEHPSVGLTPARLAVLLRQAEDNDAANYFALAEEMEEKDLHYTAVLGTRKRQVSQLEITIEPASEAESDVANAELCQEFIDRDVLQSELFDLLDSVGKGIGVSEIIWDVSERDWRPRELVWVDPRWICFNRIDRRKIQLKSESGEGIDFAPYKFVRHFTKAKSGLPVRGGIARLAAWAYLFKNFTLKGWVEFAEIYGQPLRVGRYDGSATEEDKRALLRAVSNIGRDAAAIIPQSMLLEFIEAQKGGSSGGADIYHKLATYIDHQISKAVLGQTATTDAIAGGHAVGKEHNDVRGDIERSDANELEATLKRDVFKPLIDLNRGPQEVYPRVHIGRASEVDLDKVSQVLHRLVPMGLEVGQNDVRSMLGFEEPKKGDSILQPVNMRPAASGDEPPPETRKITAAATAQNTRDAIDDLADQLEEFSGDVVDGMVNQIRTVVADAKSLDEVRNVLLDLLPDLDDSQYVEILRRAMTVADLAGRDEAING